MDLHFLCRQTDPEGTSVLQFLEPTPFATVSSWDEVRALSAGYDKLLVLGVFDWSNYSHNTLCEIMYHYSAFEQRRIGLAAFCLGSAVQFEHLFPACVPYYNQATTEPAMLIIKDG